MVPELIGFALVMGLAAPLVSLLKSWIARKPNVEIKVGARGVTLDLDRHLQAEEVKDIIRRVVKFASTGDEAGLRQVVSDSHAASERVRRRVV
jgi:hypothetical protein